MDPLSPFRKNKPNSNPTAIEMLKEGLGKWLQALRKLLGEVKGAISLEQSALSFQAVTDAFYDTWLKAEDGAASEGNGASDKAKALDEPKQTGGVTAPGTGGALGEKDAEHVKSGFDGRALRKVEMSESMFLAVYERYPSVAEVHMRVNEFLELKEAAEMGAKSEEQ